MIPDQFDIGMLDDLRYRARCQSADWLFDGDDLCLTKKAIIANLIEHLDGAIGSLEDLMAETAMVCDEAA